MWHSSKAESQTQVLVRTLTLMTQLCDTVQSLSHVRFFVTPWTAARQASLSFTISRSLLKCMSIESVIPSNQIILLILSLALFRHMSPVAGSAETGQTPLLAPAWAVSVPRKGAGKPMRRGVCWGSQSSSVLQFYKF